MKNRKTQNNRTLPRQCDVLATGAGRDCDFRRTKARVHAVVSYSATDAMDKQSLYIDHSRLISCSPAAHYRSPERICVNRPTSCRDTVSLPISLAVDCQRNRVDRLQQANNTQIFVRDGGSGRYGKLLPSCAALDSTSFTTRIGTNYAEKWHRAGRVFVSFRRQSQLITHHRSATFIVN